MKQSILMTMVILNMYSMNFAMITKIGKYATFSKYVMSTIKNDDSLKLTSEQELALIKKSDECLEQRKKLEQISLQLNKLVINVARNIKLMSHDEQNRNRKILNQTSAALNTWTMLHIREQVKLSEDIKLLIEQTENLSKQNKESIDLIKDPNQK